MSMTAYQNDHGSYLLDSSAAVRTPNSTSPSRTAPPHSIAATVPSSGYQFPVRSPVNHAFVSPSGYQQTSVGLVDYQGRPVCQQYVQVMPRTYSSPAAINGAVSEYVHQGQDAYAVQQNIQDQSFTAVEHSSTNSNTSLHLNVPLREEPYILVQPVEEPKTEPVETAPASTSSEEDAQEPELVEGEIEIQIRNVVCNYTLPLHIDLHRVALNSGNVTFDRGRGVLLKQKRNPSCYVKVYSSGKIYIVGCRSESECKRAARGVARMVQKRMGREGDVVRIRNYRVCNVLATCKMPFGIKIEELAQKYPQNTQYEPELSVGLVWRSVEPKATLRIHTTGSITVTGAVSEEDVMKAIEIIYPIVKEFRCALRLRDAGSILRRKQAKKRSVAPNSGENNSSFSGKRTRPAPEDYGRHVEPSSGVIGNKVYFSDEDEFYDEDEY